MLKVKSFAAALLVGVSVAGMASPARASIQIKIVETGVGTIFDTGVVAGNATSIGPGTYGDLTVASVIGLISSSSNSPGGTSATLTLSNANISTTGAHTFTIVASSDGFTSPVSPPNVFITSTSSISNQSGTTSAAFTSSVGTSLLDTSIASAPTISFAGSGIYSGSGTKTSGQFALSAPYALTTTDVITFGTGGGSITVNGGNDAVTAVPEPSTVVAALTALPLLGLALRRRRSR
jgi:hypothetical protein